jgi:outer membrane protein OmpA-like peptidoglycan-associated protein
LKSLKVLLAIASLPIAVLSASAAQNPPPAKQPIYTISINVVDHSTKSINYQHRNGATKIDFRGTALMTEARGEAKVESKKGYTEIEVEFDDLQPATRFGPELLTYVMWSITPEGRVANLGEIILNGSKGKLDVTTELQAFGLIVTAEPYFSVTQPSDVVVMENFVRKDTVGKVEEIDAKYALLQRGHYTVNVLPADLKPIALDKNTPLDLYEARNAVRIAGWAGADKSAADSYQKAVTLLARAETAHTRKEGSKAISDNARQAVQTAEDSRLITLKSMADARLEAERAASAGREANANVLATNARTDANNAERATADAQAQTARARSDAQAAAERASTDASSLAERNRLATALAAETSAHERDSAATAAATAAREKLAAADATQLALKMAGDKSDREKQELRSKLATQLNLILQTTDTARGLIVNLSDVLFDSGKYTINTGAREKLAKISGIVLAYPTLKLAVEGFTDSVGTEESNQKLSENRANSVRDYLVQQGISSSIAATGFGENQPVASNDTAAGRQQNRRVELIVSGDVIGIAPK